MGDTLLIQSRPSRAMAVALLETEKLPTEDLAEEPLEHFFYAGSEVSPVALVGLEVYGPDALLRSLIVQRGARGMGIGSNLVRHAESHAAAQGVRSIFLLTTTAEAFFKSLEYARVDRSLAPRSIQASREYSSLCPQSAAFMVKQLQSQR
jgi:amino-acid N-acetyltransferase